MLRQHMLSNEQAVCPASRGGVCLCVPGTTMSAERTEKVLFTMFRSTERRSMFFLSPGTRYVVAGSRGQRYAGVALPQEVEGIIVE